MPNDQATLRFTPYAWAKLLHMRDAGDTEISGFGIAEDIEDPLLITDFLTLRQECDAAYTELGEEAIADFFDAMVDRGLAPRQFARVWVHTHPASSATPSTTDEQTFEQVFADPDWAVMFILARGGQITCRLRMSGVVTITDKLPVDLAWDVPFPASNAEAWQKEYEANISEKKPGPLIAARSRGESVSRTKSQDTAQGDRDADLWGDPLDPADDELGELTRAALMNEYFAAAEAGDEEEADAIADRLDELEERASEHAAQWEAYAEQLLAALRAASGGV